MIGGLSGQQRAAVEVGLWLRVVFEEEDGMGWGIVGQIRFWELEYSQRTVELSISHGCGCWGYFGLLDIVVLFSDGT